MDFAKAQLSKYGWKEGKGLGASEAGIKEALKVKLKFDSAGLGHDRAEEFTFHWWDHVYNKVAGNLEIKKDEAGTVVLEQKEEIKISKKKPAVLNKQIVYGNFVKGGTLHGSELVQKETSLVSDEDEVEEQSKDLSLKLSDDELFKICGGRTAHKAARHGLKMTAKLSRVEAQEQLYLEKWGYAKVSLPNIKTEMKQKEQDSDCEETSVNDTSFNNENDSHRGKQEYLQKLENLQTPSAGVNIVKKKKKKRKERDFCDKEVKFDKGDITTEEHSLQELGISATTAVKKEKRKKNKDFGGKKGEMPNGNDTALVQENYQDVDIHKLNHSVKKEKKKTKNEQQKKTFNGEATDFEAGDTRAKLCTHEERIIELGQDTHKKSKKKKEMMKEDMVVIEENVPRKKRKKKYVHVEAGYEAAVKQDGNVGRDMITNLNQGKRFKYEEKGDSEKFDVNQLDKEVLLESKKKKKTVENVNCIEISWNEKFDIDIVNKRSKNEKKSNSLDEFHNSSENGTMNINGEKKKKKKKILSDITTDKEEESKPVTEFEEIFLSRCDSREVNKKKKHKKKRPDVAEVMVITEFPRNSCVKKKKKKKVYVADS